MNPWPKPLTVAEIFRLHEAGVVQVTLDRSGAEALTGSLRGYYNPNVPPPPNPDCFGRLCGIDFLVEQDR